MQVSGKVDVAPWGPSEIRAPFIDQWQGFMDEMNEKAETEAPTLANGR